MFFLQSSEVSYEKLEVMTARYKFMYIILTRNFQSITNNNAENTPLIHPHEMNQHTGCNESAKNPAPVAVVGSLVRCISGSALR